MVSISVDNLGKEVLLRVLLIGVLEMKEVELPNHLVDKRYVLVDLGVALTFVQTLGVSYKIPCRLGPVCTWH